MLYLSNCSRDQKQAKVLLLPRKFVKDGVMNESSRKISVMSWRCEEFGIQQVEQSAGVFFFAEVTTTR